MKINNFQAGQQGKTMTAAKHIHTTLTLSADKKALRTILKYLNRIARRRAVSVVLL